MSTRFERFNWGPTADSPSSYICPVDKLDAILGWTSILLLQLYAFKSTYDFYLYCTYVNDSCSFSEKSVGQLNSRFCDSALIIARLIE